MFSSEAVFFVQFSTIFKNGDSKILKDLANHKDMIICKPDKGRRVVVLDKSTYLLKMSQIISDACKFEAIYVPLDKYTRTIKDIVNNFLHKI